MDNPVIHDVTFTALNIAMRGNHHAFALVGPFGGGKSYLANWLAKRLLAQSYRPENIKKVSPIDGTIGIDQIREITGFLKLKTSGTASVRRVIIIEDAHMMSLEAQNSLLKSLEEPPEDTRLILTVVGQRALLPTVYSRLHKIDVLPIAEGDFKRYLKDSANEKDIIRAYAISGGLIGLGLALIHDKEHQLSLAISEAKEILSKPIYERLLLIDGLSKDKDRIRLLLFALKRLLSAGVAQANGSQSERILNALKLVYQTEADMLRNPNPKLSLTNVMLSL